MTEIPVYMTWKQKRKGLAIVAIVGVLPLFFGSFGLAGLWSDQKTMACLSLGFALSMLYALWAGGGEEISFVLRGNPVFALKKEGFHLAYPSLLVPWDEISHFLVFKSEGEELLGLVPKNKKAFFSRLRGRQDRRTGMSRVRFGTLGDFPIRDLSISDDELLSLLTKRFKRPVRRIGRERELEKFTGH